MQKTLPTQSAKSRIKALAKRILPTGAQSKLISVRTRRDLRLEYRADRLRYSRHSLPGEICRTPGNARNLEAQLIKDYHRVEKGLALPAPRRPFGSAVNSRLQGNIEAGRIAGTADLVIKLADDAHQALQEWNSNGVIADEIAPASKVRNSAINDPSAFFSSRHSVRDFGATAVSDDTLNTAVHLAIHSPSVCNRQAWFARFFRGDDVRRVLAYQNGNSGFTDVVPVVGLITVDTQLFAAPGERNQPWIEGGIFSMSLVWVLHALGVDSCMLNMSVRTRQATALREELGLADSELIIMMIAIGYARPGHRVARSPRREVQDIVIPAK